MASGWGSACRATKITSASRRDYSGLRMSRDYQRVFATRWTISKIRSVPHGNLAARRSAIPFSCYVLVLAMLPQFPTDSHDEAIQESGTPTTRTLNKTRQLQNSMVANNNPEYIDEPPTTCKRAT